MQENVKKASIVCCENELDSLGGCDGSTPEQISAQLQKLNQRLRLESQRHGILIFICLVATAKQKLLSRFLFNDFLSFCFLCRYSESIDDLRMLYEKKERKIIKRQQVYKALRLKLHVCFLWFCLFLSLVQFL